MATTKTALLDLFKGNEPHTAESLGLTNDTQLKQLAQDGLIASCDLGSLRVYWKGDEEKKTETPQGKGIKRRPAPITEPRPFKKHKTTTGVRTLLRSNLCTGH